MGLQQKLSPLDNVKVTATVTQIVKKTCDASNEPAQKLYLDVMVKELPARTTASKSLKDGFGRWETMALLLVPFL